MSSAREVKPTRSQKSAETTLRSCWMPALSAAVIGAPHAPQNRNPSGFSRPQRSQSISEQ